MKFGEIIEAVKSGSYAARPAWNANEAHIWAQGGFLFWKSKDHPEQHYHAIHADIFAEDWEIVEAAS